MKQAMIDVAVMCCLLITLSGFLSPLVLRDVFKVKEQYTLKIKEHYILNDSIALSLPEIESQEVLHKESSVSE